MSIIKLCFSIDGPAYQKRQSLEGLQMENIAGLCYFISCFDTSCKPKASFILLTITLGECQDKVMTLFHYEEHVDICLWHGVLALYTLKEINK